LIRTAVAFACILFAFTYSHSAKAGEAMQLRGYAFAPPAFKSFCSKQSGLCSTNGGNKVVQMTAARRAELSRVNSMVNSKIKEKSDKSTSGKADVWKLPTKEGDCEDFAIMKKSELIKRGWPRRALLLTVGRLGSQGHTVLTVRTSEGDLILDNRTSSIRNWSSTPYRYYARQSQSNGSAWERITPAKRG
jgi:predicted transglutaminase-like cysteine proteinase